MEPNGINSLASRTRRSEVKFFQLAGLGLAGLVGWGLTLYKLQDELPGLQVEERAPLNKLLRYYRSVASPHCALVSSPLQKERS